MSRLLPRIRQPHTKWLLVCLLALSATACSSTMKYSIDQSAIHDNPHPRQKYEVIVTSDAPGPWESVQGYVGYTVTNVKCVPKLPLEGAREVPNTGRKFELTSVDGGKTWVGYFYRDAIQDEDYFDRGTCHWDVESVGPSFYVHGEVFGPGIGLQEMLVPKTYTDYFKNADYFNKAINGGLQGSTWRMVNKDAAAEVAKNPASFFPMTISVKEVTP